MLQSPWQITLLGGFALKQRSRETPQPVTNQMALLVALLGDRLGRQRQRTELLEELWPNVAEDARRNRFRVLLAELRQILEPPGTPAGSVLCCDRNVASLSASACWVDTDDFQKHMQQANQGTVNETRIEHYRIADGIYSGDFLAGRDEEWVQNQRSHYARLQSLGQFKLSALLEESGDLPAAMIQIARSIEADPLREVPRRRALRLLVEAGDVGSALAEYESYKSLLKKSVGLSPTAEFQDWIRGLKGWAGAKRVSKPEPIVVQPARTTVPNVEPSKLVLPPSLSSFVGRHADVAQLSGVLPLYRWVTLTGPGGIGKSRLAIEASRMNAGLFGAGVIYVPIGETPLIDAVLEQVGIVGSLEPLETLRQYLGQPVENGRNASILILDGIDQLAENAGNAIQVLLTQIPNCTILATSRKRLGILGEHEYPVAPLAIPDPHTPVEDLLENASVQLFFERAQAASSRFRLTKQALTDIGALSRRLEGMPLALELAAAQAGTISPGQILRKISDVGSLEDAKGWREPRHRSLQASLAVSLDALPPDERKLFCSLCAFRGGFDAESAAAVAGASAAQLSDLAGHSLLIRSPNPEIQRFSILGIVQEFGWSRISESEKNSVLDRLAAYFLRLVLDAEELHFNSGIQLMPKIRLEPENILLAANWMLQQGETEAAVRLTLAVLWTGIHSGFLRRFRELISGIRDSLSLSEVQEARLKAAEGMLACVTDDPETGRQKIALALPVFEEAGLHMHAASLRWTLAYAAYLAGDYGHCLTYAAKPEEHLERYQNRIDAYRRNLLGMAYCELGMLDEAGDELSTAFTGWLELGDQMIANLCQLSLTRVAWKQGLLDKAWAEYKALAEIFERNNNPRAMIYATEGLGRVAADFGRVSQAARLLGASQRYRESIGLQRDFSDRAAFERAISTCKGELGDSFDSDWRTGYAISPVRIPKWVLDLVER